MGLKQRLDKELQARDLAVSRSRAVQLIEAGTVTVDGHTVEKPSHKVTAHQDIQVTADDPWVSRAAHKLIGALEAFPQISVEGKRCLDAGASTGGFTQVLLSRGAEHVVALDVGHGQLVPEIASNPRVTNLEGMNLRYADLGERFPLIVADLSFISLRLVMERFAAHTEDDADLVLMVKPQFEVGRRQLARTGVVQDPAQRRAAVESVMGAAADHRLLTQGVASAPLAGQDGNAEFFLHLKPAPPGVLHNHQGLSEGDDRLTDVSF